MNLDRLKSFPVIAAAALLLAALLGLLLGFLTSVDAPHAAAGQTTGSVRTVPKKPLPAKDAPIDRPRDPLVRPDQPHKTDHTTPPDRKDPPVRPETAKPRQLQPGRVDELVTTTRNENATASVIAQAVDPDGNNVSFAALSISVKSPGVGWQVLTTNATPLGEGRFEFRRLYAGEYRIRNENPNYRPVEEVVTLATGETDRVVRIVLAPAERARVEFFIHMEDNSIPQFATIQILRGNPDDGQSGGRFGNYEGSVLMAPGVVQSSTARYAPDRATGLIPFTVAVGTDTRFVFATVIDNRNFGAERVVKGEPGLTQVDVTLKESDIGKAMANDGDPRKLSRLELTLTLNGGKPVSFTRVNLRQSLSDFQYRDATRSEGSLFVWENILSGKWVLVAEASEFHAAFVAHVEIGATEQQSLEIRTGHLRVTAAMDAGTAQGKGAAAYQVRLRPQGAGTVERVFTGNITGKTSDFIDFFVPEGEFEVRLQAPVKAMPFDIEPAEQRLTMAAGGDVELTFTLRAATNVEFQCVNGAGAPVPGVEFLFTTSAAGSVPESEKSRVLRGGVDGKCSTSSAPAGPVYLMIWSSSKDWNSPDKVFKLDLPAYGTKDLGGLVIAP